MPLSIRVLATGILLSLLIPGTARTQTPQVRWANVIQALEAGVKPEVLRSTMRGDRCLPTEPTAEEVRQLTAALSDLGISLDEQVELVADLQCEWGPVQESVGDAREIDVSSPSESRTGGTPLVIESEDPTDGVTVNGGLLGRVPQRTELQPGQVYRIRIGQGPEAVDTTITSRGGSRTIVLRKTRLVVTTQGPPVPSKGALEQELEDRGLLPFVPAIPPTPTPPRSPRGRATFLFALLAGGGAFAASAGPCTSMATSPSPDGGVFSGRYYPPGTVVGDAKLMCSGATAGATFLGTALVTSYLKRAAYRKATAAYNTSLERLADASRRQLAVLAQRQIVTDSALAVRRQLSSRRTVTVGLSGAERPMDASAFEVRPEAGFQGTRTSLQLRSTVPPSEVRWTSSDESLASVDSRGVVRFLRQGEVTISGTYGAKTWRQEFDVWERLASGAIISLPDMGAEEYVDFALVATPGESYRIQLQGRRMNEDADLYVFSPGMDPSSAEAICSSTGSSSNEQCDITIQANAAGLWRIRVSAFNGQVRGLRIRIGRDAIPVIPEIDLVPKLDLVPEIDVVPNVFSLVSQIDRGTAPANVQQTCIFYEVEKEVRTVPGGEGPRYPDILKAGGVEGEVLAQFVVDTTGRVNISTYRVLRSDHAMFEQSVRSALPRMRFLPAEFGGQKVQQCVQQPFVFALQR